MKKCPVCQTRFKDKTKICRYCGVELETIPSPDQQKTTVTYHKKRKKKAPPPSFQTTIEKIGKKYWYWAYIICVLIILLYAGSHFLDRNKTHEDSKDIVQSPRIENLNMQDSDEPTPMQEYAPAPVSSRPLDAYDWFNKAFNLCPGGKCTDLQKAIEYLDNAINLKPDFAEAFINRGLAYYELGQYKRAIEDYDQAIRWKPERAASYNNRGIAYAKTGDYKRAIEDYDQAILLKPNYSLAYNNRGSAYLSLNQYEQAIENYNEAIRLKPDVIDHYKNRGIAHLAHGDKNSGCLDLNKACELGKCETLEKAKGSGSCP